MILLSLFFVVLSTQSSPAAQYSQLNSSLRFMYYCLTYVSSIGKQVTCDVK